MLEAAYDYCEALTRSAARNFYYPIKLLPRERRRAICAVYAFSRGADDIADEAGVPDRPGMFAEYRRKLAEAFEGKTAGEVFTALGDTVRRFAIPRRYFEEIIEGAEQDLSVARYRTYEELKQYCHKVAGAVGLICIEIFTYKDPKAREYAEWLGLGMQLTNILRDVGEDARRGRIYLPEEELSRFGVPEKEILEGVASDRFASLMQFQVARARECFAKSEPLFPLLPRRARFCPLALRALYTRVLKGIEKRRYDVFAHRVSLSGPAKAWCVAGSWAKAWLG